MSNLVCGTGVCGIGFIPSAAQSAPVNTPSTPGIALAALVSMRTIRACGCGERTIAAWVSPSMLKSSVKRPLPVSSRASSLRRIGWPIEPKAVPAGNFICSFMSVRPYHRRGLSSSGTA